MRITSDMFSDTMQEGKKWSRGAWWLGRLSVQLLILAQVMISWFMRSSPALGSALPARSLLGMHILSLSK